MRRTCGRKVAPGNDDPCGAESARTESGEGKRQSTGEEGQETRGVSLMWQELQMFAFSVAGATIGGSLVAWLSGYYSEKGKRLLINKEFPKLLQQASEIAYVEEKGKRIATVEDLELLRAEVRAVTKETEGIKADIQNGIWERQWLLNQKRDAYASIIDLLSRIATNALRMASQMRRYPNGVPIPEHEVQDAHTLRRSTYELEAELAAALGKASIFVNEEPLKDVESRLANYRALNSLNHAEGADEFSKEVAMAMSELRQHAVRDLMLDSHRNGQNSGKG